MDPLISNLLAVVLVVVAIFVVIKVAKAVFKFVFFIILGGLAVYLYMGGTVDNLKEEGLDIIFKETTLQNMGQLCEGTKAEKVKCTCIIQPVQADITERLKKREIKNIDKDPNLIREEIKTSLRNKKKEIRRCLTEHESAHLIDGIEKAISTIKKVTKKEEHPE